MRAFTKILAGPLLGVIAFLLLNYYSSAGATAAKMAGVAVLMAVWWLTEAVPMAIAALMPVILFPLLGILDSRVTSTQYMDPIIFLFIGGFIIAYAIEKWMLHERIALRILMKAGSKPSSILLGIMITTFMLSMWISNTATVMMLYASVMAIIFKIESSSGNDGSTKGISSALLIALAYSASIGGMATLVGTPTNMIFYRTYIDKFPQNGDVSFFSWFLLAFPVAAVLLLVTYFILKKIFLGKNHSLGIERTYFEDSYKGLGKITYEEKLIGLIFVITALLWFTRADIEIGGLRLRGWSNLFGSPDYISDGVVAIAMAVLLFFIPSKQNKGEALLVWQDITKLPFDIILLFGGGFALAKGMEVSGLSTWLAMHLGIVSKMNLILFVLLMCGLVTVISEFASNVACIQLMLPILISLQKEMDVSPLILMIPATLAASLGFMLPVATAPNTIVFSSKKLHAREMLKAGFWVDLAGIVIICILAMLAL
ncbi:MAG: SLC13/DASS family transporter [Ignavibacteria bacterium]|nr:SLC13/DASS family transporter [Ignavibacteria bacterium]